MNQFGTAARNHSRRCHHKTSRPIRTSATGAGAVRESNYAPSQTTTQQINTKQHYTTSDSDGGTKQLHYSESISTSSTSTSNFTTIIPRPLHDSQPRLHTVTNRPKIATNDTSNSDRYRNRHQKHSFWGPVCCGTQYYCLPTRNVIAATIGGLSSLTRSWPKSERERTSPT